MPIGKTDANAARSLRYEKWLEKQLDGPKKPAVNNIPLRKHIPSESARNMMERLESQTTSIQMYEYTKRKAGYAAPKPQQLLERYYTDKADAKVAHDAMGKLELAKLDAKVEGTDTYQSAIETMEIMIAKEKKLFASMKICASEPAALTLERKMLLDEVHEDYIVSRMRGLDFIMPHNSLKSPEPEKKVDEFLSLDMRRMLLEHERGAMIDWLIDKNNVFPPGEDDDTGGGKTKFRLKPRVAI